MAKVVKKLMIDAIRDRIGEASDFVILDSSRMDSNSTHSLRMQLRESGIQMMQVKNKLALVVLKEQGVEGLEDVLSGPSSILWGAGDIVELAKTVTKLVGDEETVEIKGGAVDKQPLDTAGVESWSKAKGRMETIADIAGCLLAPGRNLAGCMVGPGRQLASQIKQISEKDGEEGES